MLYVTIPRECQDEISYVVGVVFGEFLGAEFIVKNHSLQSILVESNDSNESITLPINFFLKYVKAGITEELLPSSDLDCYFELSSLPDSFFLSGRKSSVKPLPVLYGDNFIQENSRGINVGIDIFGIIFFMLTRIEELIITERDSHNRFSALSSIAYLYDFIDRPIVDEYVDLFSLCLKRLWPNLVLFNTRKRKTYISCDVDTPFDPTVQSFITLGRTCASDLIKRKSIREAFKRVRRFIYNKFGRYTYDPFYSFEWYMDECEALGLTVAFYFIPSSILPHNGNYELKDKAIKELLVNIDARGHEIGVHGTYQSYLDGDSIKYNKKLLDEALIACRIQQKVKGNRQHYLRWDSSKTPELLDAAGFEYDTTGGFADYAGFRFGTCREFSMWGWEAKKKLTLKQRPLLIMDSSVVVGGYMKFVSENEGDAYIDKIRNSSINVSGGYALLWHNSSLGDVEKREQFLRSII